ncbi:MAG TPA: toll/interleukin-1 receptor domain-containing protein [Pyrinomonadaceae bacterium]|nr:toll/interleukin-1 receptor domain-containing protein [Pyrinomonadaceae bacterium]
MRAAGIGLSNLNLTLPENAMTCPVIFICYSHLDREYKHALLSHLSVLKRNKLVEIWSDEDISAGSDWKPNILLAIERTDIAILLMTPNFLCSEFIMDVEVPKLLERRPDLHVFPILASPCLWDQDKQLQHLQVRPTDNMAVFERPDVKTLLLDLAQEVAGIVKTKSEAAEMVKSNGRPEGEAKPSRQRHAWASATLQLKLVVLAVTAFILWMVAFSFTTRNHIGPLTFPPFSVTVFSPRFLSPNEAEDIGFEIRNEKKLSDAKDGKKQLYAQFSLTGEGSGTVPCSGGGVIFAGDVWIPRPVRGLAKVHCQWDMSEGMNYLGEVARLSLEGEMENRSLDTQDLFIRVAPIPWIKKLRGYLGILVLLFWSFVFVTWLLKTSLPKRLPF